MTSSIVSHSDSPCNSHFALTSDRHEVNGIPFAITSITEHCKVVESAWMTTSQACRSRAAAEKFCEMYAPYIAAKISAWAWTMVAHVIIAMSLPTPPSAPAALPIVTLVENAERSHPVFTLTRREDIPVAQSTIDDITARREAMTATKAMQAQMMEQTGINNPLRAHDALMAEWLAKQGKPTTKPRLESPRFPLPKAAGF